MMSHVLDLGEGYRHAKLLYDLHIPNAYTDGAIFSF